ncbi:MAG: hypothetical protein ABSG06_11540 [Methanoregula sp.]|jgi:hypothetical protein
MKWNTWKGWAIVGVLLGRLLLLILSLFSLQTNPPCQCDPAYLCCGAASLGGAYGIAAAVYLIAMLGFLILNFVPAVIMVVLNGIVPSLKIDQNILGISVLFWDSILFALLFHLWEQHVREKREKNKTS